MIKRLAILSVHTSPLAPMGGKKTGGMNVYIRELAQELGSRGIQVDIFTRRTSDLEPEIDPNVGENVRVIYLTAGPIQVLSTDDIYEHLSLFTSRLMGFTMRHNIQYDIIYSNYWLSGWVAQKLKEAWGTPFVQMFHTLGHMKERILTHETILPNQRIRTETEIVRWADRLVAATPAEHSQLLWLYRADRRKIEIVSPGVNTERFQLRSKVEARQRLNLDADQKLLVFVGRIEPLKAVDTMIEALHLTRLQHPELVEGLRFAVIGGNPKDRTDSEMVKLQEMVEELNLVDVVDFLGAKDQAELPTYYAAATAVMMTSDYESFGMVALEAMASGTPVIASQVGGLAFLVRDGETGYHVPVREPEALADRVALILGDVEKSRQMGQRASHLAQDYAWPRIADSLLTIFCEILNQRCSQAV